MLTTLEIRAATARDKPFKLFDGDGLYLLVQPSGSKLWRFKYRLSGVERLISLGVYPHVSLKCARKERDACRRLVAAGQGPSRQRHAAKMAKDNTFEQVAQEFLRQQAKVWKPVTVQDATWRLESLLLPEIGSLPVD